MPPAWLYCGCLSTSGIPSPTMATLCLLTADALILEDLSTSGILLISPLDFRTSSVKPSLGLESGLILTTRMWLLFATVAGQAAFSFSKQTLSHFSFIQFGSQKEKFWCFIFMGNNFFNNLY